MQKIHKISRFLNPYNENDTPQEKIGLLLDQSKHNQAFNHCIQKSCY